MQKLIEELASLEAKATPDWYETVTGDGVPCIGASSPEAYHGFPVLTQGMIKNPHNIPLAVAMRNALPELLEELKSMHDMSNHMDKIILERDAALARAEKAKKELYEAKRGRDSAYEEIDSLNKQLEQVKTERDVLAKILGNRNGMPAQFWIEQIKEATKHKGV